VILEAKTGENLGGKWGQAVTVFLLSTVGNDDGAKDFVSSLKTHEKLQSMIYTSSDPFDKVKPLLAEVSDVAYKAYVSVNAFLSSSISSAVCVLTFHRS
jgi:hypothetical protein